MAAEAIAGFEVILMDIGGDVRIYEVCASILNS